MLEEAREGILELLGAKSGGMDADRLIFTSGGTEANNLAILGLFLDRIRLALKLGPGDPQRHPPTSVRLSRSNIQRRRRRRRGLPTRLHI